MITDEVYDYRRWVMKHWKVRVPRLKALEEDLPEPVAQPVNNKPQNSGVNSLDGSQSEDSNEDHSQLQSQPSNRLRRNVNHQRENSADELIPYSGSDITLFHYVEKKEYFDFHSVGFRQSEFGTLNENYDFRRNLSTFCVPNCHFRGPL